MGVKTPWYAGAALSYTDWPQQGASSKQQGTDTLDTISVVIMERIVLVTHRTVRLDFMFPWPSPGIQT